MNFKTLESRRYQDQAPQAQQVRVDHNSALTLAQKTADDKVRIDFGFTTSYGAMGMVKVEGSLLYQHADPDAIVAQWSKDRNLPSQAAQEVHSAILAACIPEAVGLAKGVRLPPPIPIPQVQFNKKGEGTVQAKAVAGDDPDAA